MTAESPFPRTDRLFRWGFVVLLTFAPLAFGSVQPWARALLTLGVSLLGIVWVGRELLYPDESRQYRRRTSHLSGLFAGLLWPAAAFMAVILIQVTPLWEPLLKVVSPGTAAIREMSATAGAEAISTIPAKTRTAGAQAAAMVFLFFLSLNTLRTRDDIRWTLRFLLLLGFSLALFGIIQQFVSPRSILFLPEKTLSRPFGPWVNRSHFAGWMTLVVPLGLGYLLAMSHRREEEGRLHKSELRSRQALGSFLLAVMAAALLMSLSRGGMISILFAYGVMGLFLLREREEGKKPALLLGAVFLALAVALWLGAGAIAERVGTLKILLADPLAETRFTVWKDALAMIPHFPLFGSGLGTFGDVFPLSQSFESRVHFFHAENDFVQLLVENGTAGFLAAMAGMALFASATGKMLLRRRDREVRYLSLGAVTGLAAFLLHSMTTFNFHVPANAITFAFVAALTLKVSFSKL